MPGADRYDIWVNDKSGNVSQYIRDENVATNSWTPSADMPLGLYHAWVRGVAADGTAGGWSRTTIFYVMPSPTITQGQNSTFDRTPTFAWDGLTGAVKYEVFVQDRVRRETTLYQQNITGNSFTPPADLPDGLYRWWAIGVSPDNVRSYWTDPMDIHIGGRTDLLNPVGTTSDTTPTFNWRAVDGVQRYDLWVDQIGGQSQIIRQTQLGGLGFTPSSALAAGSYRAWVRAISITGEVSPWSLANEFTVGNAFAASFGNDTDNNSGLAFLGNWADDDESDENTEFRVEHQHESDVDEVMIAWSQGEVVA
jgi:hypothetical protein